MGFERAVPKSLTELKMYLNQLADNKSHVKGVKLNPTNMHIEIDLDWAANATGHPDMYMPIKKGKHEEAKRVLGTLAREIAAGMPPSDADASQLFDLIDPTGS